MNNLFMALLLISLILLIVGLVKPKITVFWMAERTKKKSSLVYGGLIVLFFVLFGVTSGPSTHAVTNKSGALKLQTKTSTNKPTVKENVSHISNQIGLGDSKKWVEGHIGKPSMVQSKKTGNYAYDHNTIQVTYTDGLVSYYETDFDSKHEITLSQGKIIAQQMMPKDAVFVKTYNHNQGGSNQKIDVYKSKLLITRWPASEQMFTNANGVNQPGVFDVAYSYDTLNKPNKLISITVFASDNP